ncbi:NAD-dependent epimerase/dehydratase family protein [Bacteroidetes/Chlorobi group bacterium ChocPot_Mid]|nr:MAG: NAD-dependent epimerase/dehydratase family protein [Bacteroidetes/Chlorobi group bacterium ChocPot_Mid]
MQIENARILILGGWGLVGSAICHKLMEHNPKQIVISSLRKEEAEDACQQLRNEYPNIPQNMFVPVWGNIFTRVEWKDKNWDEVLSEKNSRKGAVKDIFDQLNDDILNQSALYRFVVDNQPDIVIDCINTATAIAYQNVYQTTSVVSNEIDTDNLKSEDVEKMMVSMYIPQLIRHIQILQKALIAGKSKLYLKVGTAGTGGMGLNIPYTHSEERPSRVLLAKSSVAGAQSLLLFLMARTPECPIIKEIKPTAAIAWKKIAYDTVMRKGKPIPLCDMTLNDAYSVNGQFDFNKIDKIKATGDNYKSVFIDTGENGIFSKGEFQAIGALRQMEIITPEEIAEYVVYELMAGNSGHDIVQGLDAFTLGPTYRGGMLYNRAVEKIKKLEKENNVDSIAFEMLGPPRLSKLLFEAYILKRIVGGMKNLNSYSPEEISDKAKKLIESDSKLRSEMLSIGLVVLLPDGKNYIKGFDVKIPAKTDKPIDITPEKIEEWCKDAWVDLRPKSFVEWKSRINEIMSQAESIPENETSSRFTYTKEYWDNFETFDEGKIAGWIFEYEDKGWRWKR